MNVKVMYFSKSRNTKKLADYIAPTAEVKAKIIDDLKDAVTFTKRVLEKRGNDHGERVQYRKIPVKWRREDC